MALPSAPARGVQTTWSYTVGSIVLFFVLFDFGLVTTLWRPGPDGVLDLWIMALVTASMLVQVRYCWFLRVGFGGGMPHPGWTIALLGLAGLAYVLGLFSTEGALYAALPIWMAACLIAPLLSRHARQVWLLAAAVLVFAHPLLAEIWGEPLVVDRTNGDWLLIFYAVLLPFMVISGLWWWQIVVTLDRHRAAAADLAVAEERLRFASDLHDIQGHHLQVIALKAELAERMLKRDPAAAAEQLHEVRAIAKEALEGTRSLVAGYREVDLMTELENARDVLTLTGADCTLTVAHVPTDPDDRRLLALAVREATTNVLRHSSATRASIRVERAAGSVVLTVANDAPESDPAGSPGAAGSGLAGLTERVSARGGRLDAQHDADGFTLTVTLPAQTTVVTR